MLPVEQKGEKCPGGLHAAHASGCDQLPRGQFLTGTLGPAFCRTGHKLRLGWPRAVHFLGSLRTRGPNDQCISLIHTLWQHIFCPWGL